MSIEKFLAGGWLTLLVTGAFGALCLAIRRHYRRVVGSLARLDEILASSQPPRVASDPGRPDPSQPVAVVMVQGWGGMGVHSLLAVQRLFPRHFQGLVFATVGVLDSANFKGEAEVEELRASCRQHLEHYEAFVKSNGIPADSFHILHTEAVAGIEELCVQIAERYPRAVYFTGKLVFERERWYQRLLHNETAYAMQRRLLFRGLQAVVLPIRVLEPVGSR